MRWAGQVVMAAFALACMWSYAYPRDDGRYAGSPLKEWFSGLHSGKGPCCSDADGNVVLDADWETSNGHYRVRVDGRWWDVPDEAVVAEPNRYGRTMVWPVYHNGYNSSVHGEVEIRCFMPGVMM